MTATRESKMVNGWRNRQTCNVALRLENDEGLYFSMVEYATRSKMRGLRPTYRKFIAWAGLIGQETPDGYSYSSQALDYSALGALVRESV